MHNRVLCLWLAGQQVVLNFVNFSKARALFRHGMTPLVRSGGQPQWARLPPTNCFYYKSPRHRTSNVLSVLFTIDRSAYYNITFLG